MRWLRKLRCFLFGHDVNRVMVRTSNDLTETKKIGYEICRRCTHTKVIK